MLAVVATVSCNSIPAPPVSVPFDIASKGAKSSFKFRITEGSRYKFYLNKDVDNEVFQRDYRKGLYENEDFAKSKARAIHLKLIQIEKEDLVTLIDNDFTEHERYSWGMGGTSYTIIDVDLKPGIYEATATSLDNIPVYRKMSAIVRWGIVPPRRK